MTLKHNISFRNSLNFHLSWFLKNLTYFYQKKIGLEDVSKKKKNPLNSFLHYSLFHLNPEEPL